MESLENQNGKVLHKYAIDTATTHTILYTLFFLSGVSALIYQIMWQRMLFTIFGVDLTSITIIISVFMFGLGIGGLLGGAIADIMTKRLLILYVFIELGIALFGFISPALINGLGNVMFSTNELLTGFACFAMLAFPTILMGATFPILVTHVNQHYQNVGKSVGNLYFVNTMGAAVGAYFSGFILLSLMGLSGSVDRAAILNLVIAGVAYIAFRGK